MFASLFPSRKLTFSFPCNSRDHEKIEAIKKGGSKNGNVSGSFPGFPVNGA